ncbi:TYW1B protein [Salpingoeca rosetta]|uniref:TYW1B protein n=1 Tax=Salpingoeca rosetta (strain ATCC 50818 / BSB-021) TaxID=946362 RepID=F2US29_SALR5|nr:TYW1B protein [Salpingoeca rosetta]EGD80434.1 TYW1B protein [Salpingoeca rosetta]|eukprot:XP_004987998.1 TYW1B protein [Salpingoeca rosetta]
MADSQRTRESGVGVAGVRAVVVAVCLAIYTAWLLTFVHPAANAASIIDAWEELRLPAWVSLILITLTLYWQDRSQKQQEAAATAAAAAKVAREQGDVAEDDDGDDTTCACGKSADSCCQSSDDKAQANGNDTATCCSDSSGQAADTTSCCQDKGNSDATDCCQGQDKGSDSCGCSGVESHTKPSAATKATNANSDVPEPATLNFKYVAKKHANLIDKDAGLRILYGTVTGTAKAFAERLGAAATEHGLANTVETLESLDVESLTSEKRVCVFIVSTYEHGTPPKNAEWFYTSLLDAANDHRVKSDHLSGVRFAVFGLGNSLYHDNFNKVAREIDIALSGLGAKRVSPLCLGDENVSKSAHGALEKDYDAWQAAVIGDIDAGDQHYTLVDAESRFAGAFDHDDDDDDEDTAGADEGMVDMEDMGDLIQKGKARRAMQDKAAKEGKPREMITPNLRKALTKQGYRLIGSHSGVKLCRWTKSMLRGRGGCYKHTFYGIESHRCMETTPSLACANKCVFCWRYHTNPVGTECPGEMDEPLLIDSLKKIDRPLFRDFWERFIESLKALSLKGQRTVYRLTIVKAWNSDEVDGYVNLVTLGQPDFIEVKGVTYCGSSKASSLTMSNVPYHDEVVGFVRQVIDQLPDYEIVCEHEHSNSVLAVHKKFFINGRWHTWIDYDKFLELAASNKPFSALDYVAPTPEWAIVGHPQRGFDPAEVRHRRNKPVDSST